MLSRANELCHSSNEAWLICYLIFWLNSSFLPSSRSFLFLSNGRGSHHCNHMVNCVLSAILLYLNGCWKMRQLHGGCTCTQIYICSVRTYIIYFVDSDWIGEGGRGVGCLHDVEAFLYYFSYFKKYYFNFFLDIFISRSKLARTSANRLAALKTVVLASSLIMLPHIPHFVD